MGEASIRCWNQALEKKTRAFSNVSAEVAESHSRALESHKTYHSHYMYDSYVGDRKEAWLPVLKKLLV